MVYDGSPLVLSALVGRGRGSLRFGFRCRRSGDSRDSFKSPPSTVAARYMAAPNLMSSVKLHVFRGEDDGTHSCDYRGDKFIGSPVDEHRTVLEIDPANEATVTAVIAKGPELNALLKDLTDAQPDALGPIASALGLKGTGKVGLRLGVWDE